MKEPTQESLAIGIINMLDSRRVDLDSRIGRIRSLYNRLDRPGVNGEQEEAYLGVIHAHQNEAFKLVRERFRLSTMLTTLLEDPGYVDESGRHFKHSGAQEQRNYTVEDFPTRSRRSKEVSSGNGFTNGKTDNPDGSSDPAEI